MGLGERFDWMEVKPSTDNADMRPNHWKRLFLCLRRILYDERPTVKHVVVFIFEGGKEMTKVGWSFLVIVVVLLAIPVAIASCRVESYLLTHNTAPAPPQTNTPSTTRPQLSEVSPRSIADTNAALFSVYIGTNDLENSNTVTDSQQLTQDNRTLVLLPRSRQINLKLKTDKDIVVPTYCVSFYSDLSTNDVLPKSAGWASAEPESAVSEITGNVFFNTNVTHLTWTSSEPYNPKKVQLRSLAIATNFVGPVVDAKIEVFSDAPRSEPQQYLVRFVLGQ